MRNKKYLKIIAFMIPYRSLFLNWLVKKNMTSFSIKKANPFVLHKKGFTVIGMLVASAIGLIVVTGLGQMFSNIYSQLRQVEQKAQRIFLNAQTGSQVNCTRTLKPHGSDIIQGQTIDSFSKLELKSGEVINARNLSGHNYFQLKCSDDTDPTDPDPCKCVGESSPCNRKWTLSFISQSELNGLPVYNKNFSVALMVKYPLTSSGTLTSGDEDKLSCNISNIADSASPPSSLDCIRTDKTKNLALVGCGTTTQITESSTTAYGYNAGSSSSTGLGNTFLGFEAGKDNATGYNNTFLGFEAGTENTTGYNNTFLGFWTGGGDSGYNNTFVGYRAGSRNYSGHDNTFVGYKAGLLNGSGNYNTFVGREVGWTNSGDNNTLLGVGGNSTGYENTFIGGGYGNRTGYKNTFVGVGVGTYSLSGYENTFIGNWAGSHIGVGNNRFASYGNTFVGRSAGSKGVVSRENTFIGNNAGYLNAGWNNPIPIRTRVSAYYGGWRWRMVSTYRWTFLGKENTFVGHSAGRFNHKGEQNTFVGNYAGHGSLGDGNTFLGRGAGMQCITTSIVFNCSPHMVPNNNNTFVGRWAGHKNTSGNSNTFLGAWAGERNKTGSENTFLGERAGKNNSIGGGNTFIGFRAGVKNRQGDENTFIGHEAGAKNEKGSGNIFIGFRSADITLSYEIADNKFVIGNGSYKEWIQGDIGTGNLYVNGQPVRVSSSRVLKKNIKPYQSFDEALEDILKTPLFTYEYKKDHPEKSRMGIIAEELPPHLRLKDKKGLAYPDWPSIYGTFWAGIKALHEMIVGLKQDISTKQQALGSRWKQLNRRQELLENKQAQLNRELSAEIKPSAKALVQSLKHFKKEVFLKFKTMDQAFQAFKEELSLKLKALTSHVENLRKQLEKLIQEFSQFRTKWLDWKEHLLSADKGLAGKAENLSKELARAKARQSESNKQLVQNRRELAEVEKALDQNHKEIQALKKQLQSLN